jgi:hypothetical protein
MTKEYTVHITEEIHYEVKVEAQNQKEALKLAVQNYGCNYEIDNNITECYIKKDEEE